MKRTLSLVTIVLALILSACAPALPAQSAGEGQPPTMTMASPKKEQPQQTKPAQLQPSATTLKAGSLESSLLIAAWDSSERKYFLHPLHPESGETLPGYAPIPVGRHIYHALAPDGNRLAFIVFASGENPVGGSLLLFDVQRWSAQTTPLGLDGFVTALGFSPDGRRLAIAHGNQDSQVILVDLEQGAIVAQTGVDFLASRLKYTSDGSEVFLYGTPLQNRFTANESAAGPPQVVLLDGQDLSLRWSAILEGVRDGIYPKEKPADEKADLHQPGAAVYDLPGGVFAPDRDALYVMHSTMDKLTTVDFVAQKVETVDIHPPLSWIERLLWLTAGVAKAKVAEGTSLRARVSPDGQLLYVVGLKQQFADENSGDLQLESTQLGLQVIQIASGTLLARMDTPATDISISPQGDHLYLHEWKERGSTTEVTSSANLEIITRLQGNLAPVVRMNGQALLASVEWISSVKSRMLIVDPESLTVLADWSGSNTIFIGTP